MECNFSEFIVTKSRRPLILFLRHSTFYGFAQCWGAYHRPCGQLLKSIGAPASSRDSARSADWATSFNTFPAGVCSGSGGAGEIVGDECKNAPPCREQPQPSQFRGEDAACVQRFPSFDVGIAACTEVVSECLVNVGTDVRSCAV